MKLLITPALKLNEYQISILGKQHELFFLEDERISINEQVIHFDPKEIEGIICNFFFVNNSCEMLPNLKVIQLTSAGMDKIPLEEINRRKIKLYSAGNIYAIPMAEWAVGKALEIYKYSYFFYLQKEKRIWHKNREIRELAGKKATIIGYGNVGENIARRLKGFDVEIVAVDIKQKENSLVKRCYPMTRLKEAVKEADFIFLSLPLVAETYHIIDEKILSCMKEDVVLVNVARGALIDQAALVRYLKKSKFLGVALDVFETEPLEPENELWDCENVIITPHNSFVGEKNSERLFNLVVQNLENI